MSARICPWEGELLDAMQRGYVGADLEEHIAQCEACLELHTVAGAILNDRSDAIAEAHVPDSGAMLWRMQVRHRREMQAAARRSLLIGQVATVAIAIVLVVSLFGVEIVSGARQLAGVVRVSVLYIAIAMSVLVIPLAGFVAIRQK